MSGITWGLHIGIALFAFVWRVFENRRATDSACGVMMSVVVI